MKQIRTCLGCRAKKPLALLLRFVCQDGKLVLDIKRVLPGRGAWICAQGLCFELAIQKKAFYKGLKSLKDVVFAQRELLSRLNGV